MPSSIKHRKRMLQHLEEQQRQRARMKAAPINATRPRMQILIDGIRIDVTKTRDGNFYGSSPDMRGLHLFGRNMDELKIEASKGIRDLRPFTPANDR